MLVIHDAVLDDRKVGVSHFSLFCPFWLKAKGKH